MRSWFASLLVLAVALPAAVVAYEVDEVRGDGVVVVVDAAGERRFVKPWGAEFPGPEHLDGWRHVFSLGPLQVDPVEVYAGEVELAKLTVAGIPAERLLLAQGSALPVAGQTDRLGQRYAASAKRMKLGVHAQTTAAEDPPPPPLDTLKLVTTPIGDKTGVCPINASVGVIDEPERPLTLVVDLLDATGAVEETAEIEACGLPGPNSLIVDQRPYTPITVASYSDLVLVIESDQGLRCRSFDAGAGLPAANVLAVIDGRVLLLDGSAEAPMITIGERPDGVGQLITLHSSERNAECGEVDTAFPPFEVPSGDPIEDPVGDPADLIFSDGFEPAP